MQASNLLDFLQKVPQARVAAIALKNDEERNVLLRFVAYKLAPSAELITSGNYSPSLFGGEQIMLLDPFAKQSISEFPPEMRLLLGAKTAAPFKAIDDALVLNLEKESFRAKEDRYVQFVQFELGDITPKASAMLVSYVGTDLNLLSQEMEKLRCAQKSPIDVDTIADLIPKKESDIFWKISEELVFERKLPVIAKLETKELLILIASLRNQLETGLKLKELDGKPPAPHFPKMQGWILDRLARQSGKIPAQYFRKGLSELLDLEIKTKSTTIDPRVLLDHFLVKWQAN